MTATPTLLKGPPGVSRGGHRALHRAAHNPGTAAARVRAVLRPRAPAAHWVSDGPGRQYPYPPELVDWLGAGAAPPEAVTSCQTPPDTFRPLPLACPGGVSPLWV